MAKQTIELKPYEDDVFTGMIATQKSETPLEGEWVKLRQKFGKAHFDQMCEVLNHCQFKLDDSEGFGVGMNAGDGKWRIGVPLQWNGGAHVDAHPEKQPGLFPSVVMDFHSHPKMGAYHSGIDAADEAKHMTGLYLVFSSNEGGFSELTSMVNAIAVVRKRKFQLHPLEVFDLGDKRPAPPIVPPNWREQISTKACPHCPKERYFGRFVEAAGASSASFKDWIKGLGRRRRKRRDDHLWGGE